MSTSNTLPIPDAAQEKSRENGRGPQNGILAITVGLASILALYYLAKTIFGAEGNYVGPDNDDALRLVMVRDLLNGQNWFDLMQYRLGIEPGTLMHWSRLIDLPIALLIKASSLFAPDHKTAEMMALFIWPVSLIFPLAYFGGLAGNRLGGKQTAIIAAFFMLAHAYINQRFAPGAIDHHNVQMVLIAALTASILDSRMHWTSGLVAGFASASALAVGAETTPLLAATAASIAIRWAVMGRSAAAFTMVFGLAFAGFTLLAYFATVPMARYFTIACDALSAGFVYLAILGGLGLSLSARMISRSHIAARFAALGAIGALAVATTIFAMPECLASPYANLDPLLTKLWLSKVNEAQSIISLSERLPSTLGGHYAPAFLAIIVCIIRIKNGERVQAHLMLGAMIAVAWAVTLIQVRGSMFANLLSIFPLALAISDLRNAAKKKGAGKLAPLGFVAITIASLPASWFLAGAYISRQMGGEKVATELLACPDAKSLQALADLPPGTVAADSNYGAPILRYTKHRVLAAPYHRNQPGMLAVIRSALEKPDQALTDLRQVGAAYLVICDGEAASATLTNAPQESLILRLLEGARPPGFVELEGGWSSDMHVFAIGK